MATKFAENDSITGATLAALSTTADIQLFLLPLLHLPESSNVLFKEELFKALRELRVIFRKAEEEEE